MKKILIFTDLPPTPKVYGLYTLENVDIYGRPLRKLMKYGPYLHNYYGRISNLCLLQSV